MRFVTLCAGFLAVACSGAMDTKAAEEQVGVFHRRLNSVQFDQIYRTSADEFRKSSNYGDTQKLLEAVHRKLGTTKSTALKSWRVNATTGGTIIQLQYATVFEKGAASEEFAYKEANGKLVLTGYNINSPVLIVN